ncbi:MAG: SHOCT domain-containing protein [Desulfotignum sp.]|nr:SHOCT domain-containing protein [Desulfotignum sp.]
MWGCNTIGSGMGHSFHGGGIIGFFIMLLIIGLIVFVLLQVFQSVRKRTQCSDTQDSLKILDARFARGEITEAEYRKMRDILCNKNGSG